jgi:hypothetical protein
VGGTGKPKDRDEVIKREVDECDFVYYESIKREVKTIERDRKKRKGCYEINKRDVCECDG